MYVNHINLPNWRLIWQTCENGVIKSFVNGLDKTTPLEVNVSKVSKEKLEKLVDNLKSTRGTHDFWACKYKLYQLQTYDSNHSSFQWNSIFVNCWMCSTSCSKFTSRIFSWKDTFTKWPLVYWQITRMITYWLALCFPLLQHAQPLHSKIFLPYQWYIMTNLSFWITVQIVEAFQVP